MRNRFKGLDLIDRVPDEQWTEVHDIVQEARIKTIPSLDAWDKCSGLVHWEDPEESGGKGGGRGDWDGEHM